MSKYPASIDNIVTLPLVSDNLSAVTGETSNRLRNAILAIEAELGVKPAGVHSTVKGRLDAIEASIDSLQVSGVEGDVTGGLTETKVMGLGGRPFSDQVPELNQIISWNGIAWLPQTFDEITVTALPTTVVLPVSIDLLAGDGYSSFSSPTRVGSRGIDLSLYPATYPDGRTRTIKFVANLEVSNDSTTGFVQLKDITNNSVITVSTLSTSSLTSEELSIELVAGDAESGLMREDEFALYEVQVWVEDGGISDQVICRNARIDVSYSSPILVSALVPLALPVDINLVCGQSSETSESAVNIGSRGIDMTKFTPSLPDGRVRTVKFLADVEVSDSDVDGYLQLWDATNDELVTGTSLHFTNTTSEENSVTLNVGSNSGDLKNDETARYEVRVWKVNGSVSDRVICTNARIQVTYA